MTALTGALVQHKIGVDGYAIQVPMTASVTIYQGGGVILLTSTKLASPAADTASAQTIGVALETKTSTASATAAAPEYISVCIDCIRTFTVGAGDAAVGTYLGTAVYWTDDQTVDLIAVTTNDIKAGICVGVDSATQIKVLVRLVP